MEGSYKEVSKEKEAQKMITILFDTAMEYEAIKDFILRSSDCVDFSDRVSDEKCTSDHCISCKLYVIENQIIDRSDYSSIDFLRSNIPEKTCNTCDNAQICWLACTAAAPAPCKHYRRESQQ